MINFEEADFWQKMLNKIHIQMKLKYMFMYSILCSFTTQQILKLIPTGVYLCVSECNARHRSIDILLG